MTTAQELIARQRQEPLRMVMDLPGVVRPDWILEDPEPDPCWADEAHHPASGAVIGRSAGHRWIMVQMAFTNWRLIGCPEEYEESHPVYGWCFNGAPSLLLACFAWNPEVQDEPLGWHKRAGEPRRAPDRSWDLVYNRPRCIHGGYLDSDTCLVTEYCEEFQERRDR